MAEGTTTTSASASSSRRKTRRKRNGGKKNETSAQQKGGKGGSAKSGNKKSGSGGSNNNNNSPPPPPQIKITIRNIQNSDKFGSVKLVLEELVSKLIDSCVEKKANNQYTIELDRTAVRHLITEEEKIEEYRMEFLRGRENQRPETVEGGDCDPDEDDEKEKTEENKEETHNEEGANGSTVVDGKEGVSEKRNCDKLDVILAPKMVSSLPTILARPLYVVPPRKTRRRGERGGTACVLLIGPKIEQKKVVTAMKGNVKENRQSDSPSEPQSEDQKKQSDAATVMDDESGSIAADQQAAECGGDATTATKALTAAPETPISYPRELAKGRLLLSNAIKALIELAAVDSKTQEFAFSGCIVEQSMNGKTWKMFHNNNSRPDRRDGTIEGTADYKEWLENIAKQKEELKARPKPAPGGGVAAANTTTATGDEVEEDGQILSSLVQHLRAKKEEAKRKKNQKKKEENSKGGKTKGEGGQPENGKKKKKKQRNLKSHPQEGKKPALTPKAARKKEKRKKQVRAKKKRLAEAAKVAAAPMSVLKSTT